MCKSTSQGKKKHACPSKDKLTESFNGQTVVCLYANFPAQTYSVRSHLWMYHIHNSLTTHKIVHNKMRIQFSILIESKPFISVYLTE